MLDYFQSFSLAEIKRYIDIVWFKTYANLKGEHEKTYLGCIWWMIEPILNTFVFYVVFVEVLKNRTEGFVVFLYTGMVIYGWFSGGISMGANSIIGHANLIQQVRLPKALFPFIAVSNITWKFLFSLFVLFPLLWLSHAPITASYFALPLLLLLQYISIMAISMPLSLLLPYFQDGRTILTTVLSIGMWLSGVFYESDRVPHHLQMVYYLNPVSGLIEGFRAVLLHGVWPDWSHLYYGCFTSLLLTGIGLFILRQVDGKITKLAM